MKVLITAGPTHEPIDPVRYIGNRSSGQMGAALAAAALEAGHEVTLILGPVTAGMPAGVRRVDVLSSRDMLGGFVLQEFPKHDLLIMAAAVADFRPAGAKLEKIERGGTLTIQLEATEDIIAAAGSIKLPRQRTVGFSLVERGNLARSRKLVRKNLDLIVYNPIDTMSSQTIESVLLYPDGREETLPLMAKPQFAAILLQRCAALFTASAGPPKKSS